MPFCPVTPERRAIRKLIWAIVGALRAFAGEFRDFRLPSKREIVEGKSVQGDFKKFAGIHGSDAW
jgi:hypothetical protein